MNKAVRSDDGRLVKTFGKYDSREALTAALKDFIRNKGYTQKMAALVCKVSPATVTRILAGDKSAYETPQPEKTATEQDTGNSSQKLNGFWKPPSYQPDATKFARPHF